MLRVAGLGAVDLALVVPGLDEVPEGVPGEGDQIAAVSNETLELLALV